MQINLEYNGIIRSTFDAMFHEYLATCQFCKAGYPIGIPAPTAHRYMRRCSGSKWITDAFIVPVVIWESSKLLAALSMPLSDCLPLPVRRAMGVIKAWRALTCSVASLAGNLIVLLCCAGGGRGRMCVCCNAVCAAVSKLCCIGYLV